MEIVIAVYVALGFAFYLANRVTDGPQGIGNLLLSLALGGLTLVSIAIIAIGATVVVGIKRLV